MHILRTVLVAATLAATTTAASADANHDWLDRAFSPQMSRGKGKSAVTSNNWGSSGGELGVASYYWQPQAVASGGRFNPEAMTAAHKTLPFGTRVRVTHLNTGRTVDVVINDRGPFVKGRIIDLSRRAAQNLGITGSGIASVRVDVL